MLAMAVEPAARIAMLQYLLLGQLREGAPASFLQGMGLFSEERYAGIRDMLVKQLPSIMARADFDDKEKQQLLANLWRKVSDKLEKYPLPEGELKALIAAVSHLQPPIAPVPSKEL